MIKALLLDADNTLYNTAEVAMFGDMAAMRYFSKQLKGKTAKQRSSSDELYNEWKQIVRQVKDSKNPTLRSRKHSYSLLAKRYGLAGIEMACELSRREILRHLRLNPTFRRSILPLKGIKLGIITEDSTPNVIGKLERFGIKDSFSVIITSDKAKVMKPSRLYYKLALKTLKLKPSDCAVVGDSFEKDLAIPKSMGCLTIFFGAGKTEADYNIRDFKAVAKILRETNSKSL